MIRESIAAGQFYPQTEASLRRMLSGLIPSCPQEDKQDVIGAILPHAGYIYSGSVEGEVISKIRLKKTAVILGTNHTGMGEKFSIMAQGSWVSPLGSVEIDTEFAGAILKEGTMLKTDFKAHLNEHSIEVHLPFLQYVDPAIKIVPIVISQSGLEDYQKIGECIANGYKKIGRPALFIASTDMTHYEPKEIAAQKDSLAVNAILELDDEKLFTAVNANNISMCGVAPACVLIALSKILGAKKSGLVKYQTSGDVSGDYSSVVGYAGITIW